MGEYNPEKIKPYLKKLKELGIELDIEDDVMGINYESDKYIGFTIDGVMEINKKKFNQSIIE